MNDQIPIHRAELLAKAHDYDQVIIYARRVGEPGQEWVTTYGRDEIHSAAAARIGEAIGRQVVKPIEELTARAEAAEASVVALQADKERLDFLDACNAALNRQYGTNYGWELILNHNVTRVVLGRLVVDLNDSTGGVNKLPSCRGAIDVQRRRCQAKLPEPPAGRALHVELAFQAYYGAGGTDEDARRGQRVAQLQAAIRNVMDLP